MLPKQNDDNRSTPMQRKFVRDLKVGQVLTGKIIRLTDYGAFVRIGPINGLLHNNDISYERKTQSIEKLELNRRIEVVVLKKDDELAKVSLGIKQLKQAPWEKFTSKYKEGDTTIATVVDKREYGIFFQLIPGVDGLLHKDQIEKLNEYNSFDDYEMDAVFQLKIKSIDFVKKRVALMW